MPVPSASAAPGRRLLREEAYERICAAVVSGQLQPGERLNDQELAAWLGISRTPVREALARLEREGLVRTFPGRATEVVALDDARTSQAVAVIAALHALAAELAVPRLQPGDVALLEEANARFAAALDDAEVAAAVAADTAFHDLLVERSANPVLRAALEQVTPLVRRAELLRFDSLISRESVGQHAAIVAACEAGDAAEAAQRTRENWSTLAQ